MAQINSQFISDAKARTTTISCCCCLRCISKGHMAKAYSSKKKCDVKDCNSRHHSLLHGASLIFSPSQSSENSSEDKKSQSQSQSSTEKKKMVATHSVNDDHVTTLLQVVPVTVESNGKKVEFFALLH